MLGRSEYLKAWLGLHLMAGNGIQGEKFGRSVVLLSASLLEGGELLMVDVLAERRRVDRH